jgi:hypothetical protein
MADMIHRMSYVDEDSRQEILIDTDFNEVFLTHEDRAGVYSDDIFDAAIIGIEQAELQAKMVLALRMATNAYVSAFPVIAPAYPI